MTDQEKLDYLARHCPVMTAQGRAVAGLAAPKGRTAAVVIPPDILIAFIQLLTNLWTNLIGQCLPKNATAYAVQEWLVERPFLSFRGVVIRSTARRMWRKAGYAPDAVGIAVEQRCASMTGITGLRTVGVAMTEIPHIQTTAATWDAREGR